MRLILFFTLFRLAKLYSEFVGSLKFSSAIDFKNISIDVPKCSIDPIGAIAIAAEIVCSDQAIEDSVKTKLPIDRNCS